MKNPIKMSDAIRFLEAKGVARNCPSCGHDKSDLVNEEFGNLHFALPGFKFGGYDINRADMFGLFVLTCADCGYVRLFHRSVIEDWIARNPEASLEYAYRNERIGCAYPALHSSGCCPSIPQMTSLQNERHSA